MKIVFKRLALGLVYKKRYKQIIVGSGLQINNRHINSLVYWDSCSVLIDVVDDTEDSSIQARVHVRIYLLRCCSRRVSAH